MKPYYKLRTELQGAYDIKEKRLVPFDVGGREYLVYDNVNLSIFLTDSCNADCKFCVAKLRYLNHGEQFIKPCIKNDDVYYEQLDKILHIVKPLNPSISLTGGEPTISHRLPKVLEILDSHNVRKRTITTNGTGLLKKLKGDSKTVLDRLIEYKLMHLNISKTHYNNKRNLELMALEYNEMSNDDLKKIVEISKAHDVRPRMSCVLLKESINTLSQMVEYMEWHRQIGIDNVVFRQLMQFDGEKVRNDNILRYNHDNFVSLHSIWEEIDDDNRFDFQNWVLGYYYYVEVYKYKNIAMVSEMADLTMIEKQKELIYRQLGKNVIYEMVFHPNGNLCGSWREWNEIIVG